MYAKVLSPSYAKLMVQTTEEYSLSSTSWCWYHAHTCPDADISQIHTRNNIIYVQLSWRCSLAAAMYYIHRNRWHKCSLHPIGGGWSADELGQPSTRSQWNLLVSEAPRLILWYYVRCWLLLDANGWTRPRTRSPVVRKVSRPGRPRRLGRGGSHADNRRIILYIGRSSRATDVHKNQQDSEEVIMYNQWVDPFWQLCAHAVSAMQPFNVISILGKRPLIASVPSLVVDRSLHVKTHVSGSRLRPIILPATSATREPSHPSY